MSATTVRGVVPTVSDADVRRFLGHVQIGSDTECWPWSGAFLSHDPLQRYGRFRIKSRQFLAHRLAFLIHYGYLTPGLCVCRHCDTPWCVNPHHLWEGTREDNVLDCERKGRGRHLAGADHYRTKLSFDDLLAIQRRAFNGEGHRALASEYDIPLNYVSAIKYGRGKGRLKLLAEVR